MNACALFLVALLAVPPVPEPTRTSTASGLTTPLERELWRALVLLEGDTETATRALASCEDTLHAITTPARPEVVGLPQDGPGWVLFSVAVVLAVGSGLALGLLLDHGPGPGPEDVTP